jgi:Superfamily I DNA and RNA helicases
MFELTNEQISIIEYPQSCVVIARPGSGKTSTLARKICKILDVIPEYKGVIAISYTNKASDELKTRSLVGTDKKESFFGTIDKFYISEIVLPFLKHIFGLPCQKVEIIKMADLKESDKDLLKELSSCGYDGLQSEHLDIIKKLYLSGVIILDLVGILALYTFDNSLACRKYIKARYTHIIIDEYQDSGLEQHLLFLRIHYLGIIGIAVGDVNQSIYAFSHKDPKFLMLLTQNINFKPFPLSINYRSHPSIINYSNRIIMKDSSAITMDEIRVFSKEVSGDEEKIALWLDMAVIYYMQRYNVDDFNKIAILVRGNRTGEYINRFLSLKHKFFQDTPLESDSSIWGGVFKKILSIIFSDNAYKYDFLQEYLVLELQSSKAKKIAEIIDTLKNIVVQKQDLVKHIKHFISIAEILFPDDFSQQSINTLKAVLSSPKHLDSFKPAESQEVQIMTLHKSKGLEFDIVFHLDLYKYILPGEWDSQFTDYIQDLNLHYVGVTRAKQCCVLCCSTHRHNKQEKRLDGIPSFFFELNSTHELRLPSPI